MQEPRSKYRSMDATKEGKQKKKKKWHRARKASMVSHKGEG